MNQKFLDPLYGSFAIDDASWPLVFSPDFQRLRNIRLCNINSLFITGASEPKRFEHSLGVYFLASVWANEQRLPPREAIIVRAAALLHDIQTGPFGHSMQYVLEDNSFDQRFEHDDLANAVSNKFLQLARAGASFAGRRFAGAVLLGDNADRVFEAIRGEGPFGPIISGSIDLDNLDNVVRLAFHVGICTDADRSLPILVTRRLSLIGGRLTAPSDTRDLLQRWFDIRRTLYEYLLLDRGEFAAKAMLTMAVELAVEVRLLGPDSWRLTDDQLLDNLQTESLGEHQAIGNIIRRLRLGDLFECIGVWRSTRFDKYDDVSESIEKRAIEGDVERCAVAIGAGRLRCCVHFIKDHKKTRRALSFVDSTTADLVQIGDDSQQLLVGLFITNARVDRASAHDRLRYAQALRDVLHERGICDLADAPDPLGCSVEERQSELFGS